MTLKDRLLERIRAHGPLTFAAYMEAALYDPDEGFFVRAPVGREFVTSVHVSPVFGFLLARQLGELSATTVVDLGAGDGTLGKQLTAAIEGLNYIPIERSRGTSVDDIEPFEGVVIANELFDNVPFHLMRDEKEIFIAADDSELVEQEGETTVQQQRVRSGIYPVLGEQARAIIDGLAKVLTKGYVFIFDYGFVSGEDVEPIRGYSGNRMVGDLLARPGETDITGPVDFDALAEHARATGLESYGPVSQRDALMALGYREILDEMREAQRQDEQRGDWRSAVAGFSARGEASMLVDPTGLGSLKVLVLATQGLPTPRLVPVP